MPKVQNKFMPLNSDVYLEITLGVVKYQLKLDYLSRNKQTFFVLKNPLNHSNFKFLKYFG